MIYEIIKLLLICWVFKDLFLFIGDLLSNFTFENKIIRTLQLLMSYVLTCSKCSSMWFSLILSGDLFVASLIALSMKVIGVIENKYIQKTNL